MRVPLPSYDYGSYSAYQSIVDYFYDKATDYIHDRLGTIFHIGMYDIEIEEDAILARWNAEWTLQIVQNYLTPQLLEDMGHWETVGTERSVIAVRDSWLSDVILRLTSDGSICEFDKYLQLYCNTSIEELPPLEDWDSCEIYNLVEFLIYQEIRCNDSTSNAHELVLETLSNLELDLSNDVCFEYLRWEDYTVFSDRIKELLKDPE